MIAELDKRRSATQLADVTLNLQKAQAEYTTAQLDSALNLAQAREDVRTAEYTLEEKKLAQGAGAVRGADDQAPGGDRLREGAARVRAVEAQPRHEDQAGRREDVVGRRRSRPPAEPAEDHPGRDGELHHQGAVAGHGDLRPRMERQEEGRRLAVERRGTRPSRRSPISRRWSRRPTSTKSTCGRSPSARRCRSRSTPIRRRSSTGTVTQIANVGEQRPNQDSKVFEVKIEVAQADTTLRPGHDDVERDRDRVDRRTCCRFRSRRW